jgi:hypothetical protein
MAIKDQHTPLALALNKRIIMKVDEIFYGQSFIRIARRRGSKKGLVFKVVFEVLFKQDVTLKNKHRRDRRAVCADSLYYSQRLSIIRICKINGLGCQISNNDSSCYYTDSKACLVHIVDIRRVNAVLLHRTLKLREIVL